MLQSLEPDFLVLPLAVTGCWLSGCRVCGPVQLSGRRGRDRQRQRQARPTATTAKALDADQRRHTGSRHRNTDRDPAPPMCAPPRRGSPQRRLTEAQRRWLARARRGRPAALNAALHVCERRANAVVVSHGRIDRVRAANPAEQVIQLLLGQRLSLHGGLLYSGLTNTWPRRAVSFHPKGRVSAEPDPGHPCWRVVVENPDSLTAPAELGWV